MAMSSFARIVVWLGWPLLCVWAAEAGSNPLPGIVLAPGGNGFQTEAGRPFVPFGVTYYRPDTGWAPQVWKQFDAAATERDFKLMKEAGINCVRVFLSFGSFLPDPGKVSEEGLRKFDKFLDLAEREGIYVHPTGPDGWEGAPAWVPADRYADETMLRALDYYWKEFAARYRGRKVIFAIDLLNEPSIAWDNPVMQTKWRAWVHSRYPNSEAMAQAWGELAAKFAYEAPPIPPPRNAPGSKWLLDYQHFREDVACQWVRRQVMAIKSADPNRLVTAGLIQWSVPSLLPAIQHYSGFRPSKLAPLLDFLEVHFYPLDHGFYSYVSPEDEARNLAYLEGVVREVAAAGKPVVLEEFGWYGGGRLTIDQGSHPPATEQQQADWDKHAVEVSAGYAVGWLNWGLYDQPEAADVSQLTGLLTAAGKVKAWGTEFERLSRAYDGKRIAPRHATRPALDWDACLTDTGAGNRFREAYYRAYAAASR
jgi:hypothetical protein